MKRRRDPNKLRLKNKIEEFFMERFWGKREFVAVTDLFVHFRREPLIIDRNRADSIRSIKRASYEAADELRKHGLLVVVCYSAQHHHKIIGYKPFEPESYEDSVLLKTMQERKIDRIEATKHVTVDQLDVAFDMGMSAELYASASIEPLGRETA